MDMKSRRFMDRAAVVRITIKKDMIMELNGMVVEQAGSMVGIKTFATGKVYHLYQYGDMQYSNVYSGTVIAGKRRLTMEARVL